MRYSTLFMLLLVCGCLRAQVTWQYAYGGYSTEEGNSVVATTDGRYLVVGSTGSFGAGSGDIYLLMLGADGHREWSRTLGGAGVDQGRHVEQTTDGGFILVGFTNSSGNGGYDGYMARLDATGALAWERTFGGPGWDFLYSVTETSDGAFMAVGETFSTGQGGSDAWLLRVSSNGDFEWDRTYGGPETDFGRSIIRTQDGALMFAGALTTNGDQDAWLVKVEANGDTLWTSVQGGDSLDFAVSVIETLDGGYAAVGTTKSFSEFTEAYHFKVDGTGELLWAHNWGQVNDQETLDIKELPDGRFLSVGYVKSSGSGGLDMFIFFTQANGDFQSGVSNGGDNGEGDEAGASLALTPDGGAVLCGYTTSFGYGPKDVYVVKTNDTGWTETVAVVEEFDPLAVVDAVPVHESPLFPNPATTFCHFSSSERLRQALLRDSQGRTVRAWNKPIPQDLDLTGLADGCYRMLTIDTDGRRASLPLVIHAR